MIYDGICVKDKNVKAKLVVIEVIVACVSLAELAYNAVLLICDYPTYTGFDGFK